MKQLQKKHLGSFNSEFAITLSQRLALSSYLSPMDIVPVNGPPGTGKTALLRAIFSDYIVKAEKLSLVMTTLKKILTVLLTQENQY